MDMNFSAPVHQDPLLVIEIIDEAWASETLPTDDIEVTQSALANGEDEDATVANDSEENDKWTDLALEEFKPIADAPAPVIASDTPRRALPSNTACR